MVSSIPMPTSKRESLGNFPLPLNLFLNLKPFPSIYPTRFDLSFTSIATEESVLDMNTKIFLLIFAFIFCELELTFVGKRTLYSPISRTPRNTSQAPKWPSAAWRKRKIGTTWSAISRRRLHKLFVGRRRRRRKVWWVWYMGVGPTMGE